MKIYVAGKFEEKEVVLDIYKRIEELGHEVSYNWTTHEDYEPYEENQETAAQYATNELEAIVQSDVLIYLAHERGTTLPMEFGAALAMAKIKGAPKIYVVGTWNTKSPWFFNPLVQRVDSVEEALCDFT